MKVRLVVLPEEEDDLEIADRLARRLRAEVADLDIESVALADGAVPEFAKGADAVTIGVLIVALSASGGVFTALIDTMRDWLNRQSARHKISVTIDGDTIELERAAPEQKQALIEAYIARHVKQDE